MTVFQRIHALCISPAISPLVQEVLVDRSHCLVTSMARQPRSRSLSTYTYHPRRRRFQEDSLMISQARTLETFRAAISKEIRADLTQFGISIRLFLPLLVVNCLPNSFDQRSWDDLCIVCFGSLVVDVHAS